MIVFLVCDGELLRTESLVVVVNFGMDPAIGFFLSDSLPLLLLKVITSLFGSDLAAIVGFLAGSGLDVTATSCLILLLTLSAVPAPIMA